MFLKNQSTILPTNIQKIFHVSKPPRRLLRASFSGFLTFLRLSLVFLPFLPFSGYLRLSPACLHPSILPSFHPCILPSLPPDVTRQEQNLRGRPFFILTLHVRKTGRCHRGAWKASWQFPNVTRQEQNLRGRPISFLMLHVGKTGRGKQGEKCHTDHPERPQRGWNSVVPNRFGIDMPWRAVWRG